MLILTAFSVTFVALIKAAMTMFGAGLAIFLFSGILLLAIYSFVASVFNEQPVS